jgi:uncharacterized membrane protein YoaK (UPF0700 family)
MAVEGTGVAVSSNTGSPWLRFLAGIVAVAVAIRLVYELLLPVLPALVVIVVLVAIVRLVGWYRGRW